MPTEPEVIGEVSGAGTNPETSSRDQTVLRSRAPGISPGTHDEPLRGPQSVGGERACRQDRLGASFVSRVPTRATRSGVAGSAPRTGKSNAKAAITSSP